MTKADMTVDLTEDAESDASSGAKASRASEPVIIEGDDSGEPKKAKLPARAIRNDDGTVTLPLVKPATLTIKGSDGQTRQQEFKELIFHELTGADLRILAQQSEEMKGPVAFARSTRMATNRMNVLFDKLVSRDVKAGGEIISFLSE